MPAPSADPTHRFGVYAWGFDDSSYAVCDGCPDRLNWAAEKVAATGSRTIRVYLGARDDYQVNPPTNPEDDGYLLRIVAGAGYPYYPGETAYGRLFADPRFDTYLLTVYSPADNRNDWKDGWTADEAALERAQLAALGEFLLRSYPRKTFVFLNWEGDNAIHGRAGDPAAWDAFLAWMRSRTAGVRAAQAANPRSSARLFAGLEFNQLHKNGAWCGADESIAHRCVIDYVGPRVEVDYYSYSSWETLAVKGLDPTTNLKQQLGAGLAYALALLRRARPELKPANLLLGEYGFARTAPRNGECRAASYVQELIGAIEAPDAFGVSYAVFWQILDNAPAVDQTGGTYGLFQSANGEATLSGAVLRAALQGAKPPALPANCPRLNACHDDPANSCAIVDATSFSPRLTLGGAMAIFGVHFSNAGNSIEILQGSRRFVLPRDASGGWHESRGQVNVALPEELAPGPAFVYLTDSRGLDTNGQLVDLAPPAGSSPSDGEPNPRP